MKLFGEFFLMTVETGTWSDSGKKYYCAVFSGGGGSIRVNLTVEQYEELRAMEIERKYNVVLKFNPMSKSVRYCMDFVSVSEINSVKPVDKPVDNMNNKKVS